jgi:hypothetical protein
MIVYDCEIQNAIPVKNKEPIRGIKYCKGWRDFEGMGIACIAAYDYDEDVTRVFCSDNLVEFQELVMGTDVVVGYHNWNFDDPLVEAFGVMIPEKKSYDLYKEIYKAHGYTPAQRKGGLKLGDVARVNLNGRDKTDDGAMAPFNWQNGKIGTVIDYCIQDVMLARDLLDLVIKGRLASPITRRILRVKPPR